MNEYTKQAEDFLKKHGITYRAVFINLTVPPWSEKNAKAVNHYKAVFEKKDGRSLDLDFYDSIHNTYPKETGNYIKDHRARNRKPTAYDVLACISGDINTPNTFEDFCAEYGYDSDSRKAEKTFHAVLEQSRKMKAFFTTEELEELSEIQ